MTIVAMKDGTSINPAHIVQFTKLRNGETKFLLSTGDEKSGETYTDVREAFIPVIPANPGFVAVFVDRWEGGHFQYKNRSVIAWKLCPSGAYPVFEGYGEDDDYQVIIDPAGGVYDSDHNVFASLDEWKAEHEAQENEVAADSVTIAVAA